MNPRIGVLFSAASLSLSVACGAAPGEVPVRSNNDAAPSASSTSVPSPARGAARAGTFDVDAELDALRAKQSAESNGGPSSTPALVQLLGKLGFEEKDYAKLTTKAVEWADEQSLDANLDGEGDMDRVLAFRFATPPAAPIDDPTASLAPRFQETLMLVAWLGRHASTWVPVAHHAFEVSAMGPATIDVTLAHVHSARVDDTMVQIFSGAPPRTMGSFHALEIFTLERGRLESIGATGPCGEDAYVHGSAPPLALGCDAQERPWNPAKFAFE